MKIDFTNGIIINTARFSVHDDVFINMSYERKIDKGIIKLTLQRYDNPEHRYCISLVNSIGYEGTSFSFWDTSSRLSDFEFIVPEKRTLLPKLYGIQNQILVDCDRELVQNKEYIEIAVNFISGDKLTIVCEYMEIDNDVWEERSTGTDPFWQDLQRS